MRCPNCGEDNLRSIGLCKKCGKPLADSNRFGGTRPAPQKLRIYGTASATASDADAVNPRDVDYRDIPKKLKFDYEHAKDHGGRMLAAVQALMQQIESPQLDVRKLMLEASELISHQLGVMDVAIGLKGPDGLFRYDTLVGFREEAIAERKRIAYKKEEFYDVGPYKGCWISRYTKLYLSEDQSFTDSEKSVYNRPILLGQTKRVSPLQALEGDYLAIHIFDKNNELIGWVETSGTRAGQLPDAMAIRWMELIAGIIGIALRKKV